MRVYYKEIVFRTQKKLEAINITHHIKEVVKESSVKNGLAVIHAPHATAAIVLNEDEWGLKNDILEWIEKRIPYNYKWRHNRIDDNAGAHLASMIIGSTRIIPVKNNELVRGTWQEVLFLELDGPRRERRVVIEVIGE